MEVIVLEKVPGCFLSVSLSIRVLPSPPIWPIWEDGPPDGQDIIAELLYIYTQCEGGKGR